jgi:hypothetical protein
VHENAIPDMYDRGDAAAGHSGKIALSEELVMFAGRKLPLTLVFVLVVALSIGVSCKGFFVDPTVTSIAISPATPTIAATNNSGAPNTQQFTAIASFSDNSPPAATPATWTSSAPTTVASINGTSGLATAIASGTATITATSTRSPSISATTTLTIVPANVTSITVTPSNQSTTTGSTIFLKAVDQSNNDISASVTWTFTLKGTTTQETGVTKTSTLDPIQGQQFQVNTLSPAATFPATLYVVASLTVNGNTVSSPATAVTLTITS